MEDKSKQLLSPEEARLAKLLDVLKSANVGGDIIIREIILGATREEYEKLCKLVNKKLSDNAKRMNQIERENERLADGQEKLRAELATEHEELLKIQRDLINARNLIKKEKGKYKKSQVFNIKFLISAVAVLVVLFLAIFIPIMVTSGSEKEPEKSTEDLKYYAVDGGYEVSRSENVDINGTLVIPNTYNGKPVVEIKSEGFRNCEHIIEVVIPYTVKVIGDDAFSGCKILKTVSFSCEDGQKAICNR